MNAFEIMKEIAYAQNNILCAIAGAGMAAVNGTYNTFINQSAIAKHATENYYIIYAPIGEFYSSYNAYIITNSVTWVKDTSPVYYFMRSDLVGLNNPTVYVGANGTSPVPTITKI